MTPTGTDPFGRPLSRTGVVPLPARPRRAATRPALTRRFQPSFVPLATPQVRDTVEPDDQDRNTGIWDAITSIPGQFGNAAQSIGAGALTFVGDTLGGTLREFSRPLVALGQAAVGDFDDAANEIRQSAPVKMTEALLRGDVKEAARESLRPSIAKPGVEPALIDSMVDSAGNTARRVSNPTEYWDDFLNKRIVGSVLEDASNISLLAGGVAGLAGKAGSVASGTGRAGLAARFEQAANTAQKVQSVADTTGALFGAPKLLGAAGRKLVASERSTNPVVQAATRKLREKIPTLLTEAGITARNVAKEGNRAKRQAENQTRRAMYVASETLGLNRLEEGAVLANRAGFVEAVEEIQRLDPSLSFETARQMAVSRDLAEQTFTPDIADMAAAYRDRTLPADVLARMDEYAQFVDDQIASRTGQALTEPGRISAGNLDARQLQDDPFPERVDDAMKEAGSKGLNLSARQEAIDRIAEDPTMESFFPDTRDLSKWLVDPADVAMLDEVLDLPDVYAARWRPQMALILRGMENMIDQLVDGGMSPAAARTQVRTQVALRPGERLAARSVTSPGYMPGGRSNLAYPTGSTVPTSQVRPGLRGLGVDSSEQFRARAELQPLSGRILTEKLSAADGRQAYNASVLEGFEQAVADGKIPTVATALDQATRARLRDLARNEARTRRTPSTQAIDEIYGELVVDELNARGFEILAGSIDNPRRGDFGADTKVRYGDVDDSSIVLPAGVKARLMPWDQPKNVGAWLRGLAFLNSQFKQLVLPYSIRWQVGDAIGIAFMSAQGGVDPASLFASMRTLSKLSEQERTLLFRGLFDESLVVQTRDWLDARALQVPATGRGKAARALGKPKELSFRLNAWINQTGKQAFMLERLERVLGEAGLSVDDILANNAKITDPGVAKAIDEALDEANTVMGIYDEMTPIERRYIREIWPFYAWNRHISKLAWTTAVDNPRRMMWTLRLGTLAENWDEDVPDDLKGQFQFGDSGWTLPTNWFNPYNDPGSGAMYSPGGALKSMSPAIKMALAGTFGVDANNNLRPLTRPYDARSLDPYGRESGLGPLSRRFGDAFYTGVRALPQTRELMNVLPTGEAFGLGFGPHTRYGAGELIVDRYGNPVQTASRWQSLFGLVGLKGREGAVPLLNTRDQVDEILQQRDERRVRALRRADNQPRYDG